MDLRQALIWLRLRMAEAGLPEADLEAEVLLRHALGMDRAAFYASLTRPLSPAEKRRLNCLLRRRLQREPLPYLLGRREFFGLDFLVNECVLIPRQETELLVELAIGRAEELGKRPVLVADVGTGSGAIAVALARHLPEAQIVATDISWAALRVADINIRRHGVRDSVHLVRTHLLAGIRGPIDMVVANLPYIPTGELGALPPEVGREPPLALDGGPDGLAVVRDLLRQLPGVVAPGAAVILELDPRQRGGVEEAVAAILPGARLRFHRDLAGRHRAALVDLPKAPPRYNGGTQMPSPSDEAPASASSRGRW